MASELHHLILGAGMVDGTGKPRREGVAVEIKGNRIAAIRGRDAARPAGATVIDLGDATLAPGLIDSHMHFFGTPSNHLELVPTEHEAYRVLAAAGEARKMLLAGITSARDLGSSIGPYLRRGIKDGHVPGPRLVAAGEYVTTTGGTWEYLKLPIEWAKAKDIFADGADGMREIVRRRIRNGANVIKLGLSKGVLDDHNQYWGDEPLLQAAGMTLDEVKAAVAEAHAQHVMVAAHCIGDDSVVLALDGGIDTVEHAYGIKEDTRKRLADSGVLVATTISQLISHQDAYETFHYPEHERRIYDRHAEQMREDFEKSLAAGVRFVLGSDLIGYPTHPQDTAAKEFQYAVEWGMPIDQAILSGFAHAAEAIGMKDKVGTIAEGKLADLIGVKGDPSKDVKALQTVSFVMQDGKVVLRDGRAEL